jgi:hypothetical protein
MKILRTDGTHTYVQGLRVWRQFVQKFSSIQGPSHFVFPRRQASHALSFLRRFVLDGGIFGIEYLAGR